MFELNKLNVYSEAQNLTIEVLETVSKVTKGDEAVLTEVRIQAIYLLKQIARAEGSYNQKRKTNCFYHCKKLCLSSLFSTRSNEQTWNA